MMDDGTIQRILKFFSTGIIMDTIDTCFCVLLLIATTNVDRGNSEFHLLITRMLGFEPRRQLPSDDVEKVWKGPNRAIAYSQDTDEERQYAGKG